MKHRPSRSEMEFIPYNGIINVPMYKNIKDKYISIFKATYWHIKNIIQRKPNLQKRKTINEFLERLKEEHGT